MSISRYAMGLLSPELYEYFRFIVHIYFVNKTLKLLFIYLKFFSSFIEI